MIADTINQKIAEALKAHDGIRLSTLRLLSSALNYEFIAKQHKLSEEEELQVVKREAKKRKDAIGVYEKLRNSKTPDVRERIQKEKEELKILEEYLPPEMSDEEIEKLVEAAIIETGAKSPAEMGKVMGVMMAKVGGRVDGSRASLIVRKKLS